MEIVIKSKVSMPSEGIIFQGDNNMDSILVQIDRFYGDYDLVNFNAYLKIKYTDDSCNQILLKKIIERSDKLIYEARIDTNFTRYPGEIFCQPCFSNDDGSLVFNASVFTMEIEGSINAYETIEQELLPGTLQTLEAELKFARAELEESKKSTELGVVKEADLETVLNGLTDTAIYRLMVEKSDGFIEPRVVFVNRVSTYLATQTMITNDEQNFTIKILSRTGSVASMVLWQLWEEKQFVSKDYVDEQFLALRFELGLEI